MYLGVNTTNTPRPSPFRPVARNRVSPCRSEQPRFPRSARAPSIWLDFRRPNRTSWSCVHKCVCKINDGRKCSAGSLEIAALGRRVFRGAAFRSQHLDWALSQRAANPTRQSPPQAGKVSLRCSIRRTARPSGYEVPAWAGRIVRELARGSRCRRQSPPRRRVWSPCPKAAAPGSELQTCSTLVGRIPINHSAINA